MMRVPKPLKGLRGKTVALYKEYILRDEYAIALGSWWRAHGDKSLRLNYPLTEQSVVFDAGGYVGEWSEAIIERYNPFVFIFEPIPEYFENLKAKFHHNSKVCVMNVGLADHTFVAQMEKRNDGSSLLMNGSTRQIEDVQMVDIHEIIRERRIGDIALIKINIEGGEYALLQRMLQTQITLQCYNIQVQFHNFYPNAESLRRQIRQELMKTHQLTYDYPFVWENWQRTL